MRLPVVVAAVLITVTAFAKARGQPCEGKWLSPGGDVMPIMGARIGTPQILSFYTGPTWFQQGQSCVRYFQYFIEPGLGGGQLGAAYGYGRRRIGGQDLIGRIQGSILRTWGPSWHAPRATFAGGELQVARGIGVRVGYFRALDHSLPDRDLITVSFVLGY
jgi:hypothetical protein